MSSAVLLLLFVMVLVLLRRVSSEKNRISRRRTYTRISYRNGNEYREQTWESDSWSETVQPQPADLQAGIKRIDADITAFGDELRDLELEVVGHDLDMAAQQEYQLALDAYEKAKRALGQADNPTDIPAIAVVLEDGRYQVSCVRARVAGRPLPVRRPSTIPDPFGQHFPHQNNWLSPQGQPGSDAGFF